MSDPGSNSRFRRLRLGVWSGGVLVALVVLAVLWFLWPRSASPPEVAPARLVTLPLAGGDFELADDSGPWRLSAHATPQTVVLLYFGFTNCPDRCPMTLQRLARAIASLRPEERQRVLVVFVSVDYRSDTPATASAYAKNFGPEFVGLSGDSVAIERMAARFDAAYAFVPLSGSAMPYTVDHTGMVYVLDSKGNVKAQWQLDQRKFDVVKALKSQL